jgi:hypothetical protein
MQGGVSSVLGGWMAEVSFQPGAQALGCMAYSVL